ncbi:MAG: DUF805 domain-containing protein [Pseudomonadota bacterium]|nr:DUF805 domain-containing protein [Pseudomonadota bacterium]
MNLVASIQECFRKYGDFRGCASRPEFWWFTLFVFVGAGALEAISDSASLLFTLATMLPSAAVTTRRLHDVNRSGWVQLLFLIPILGWLALIILLAQPAVSPNRYATAD